MTTDYCPDFWTHRREYHASETTWRKTPEQIREDYSYGCPECRKPLPEEEPCKSSPSS